MFVGCHASPCPESTRVATWLQWVKGRFQDRLGKVRTSCSESNFRSGSSVTQSQPVKQAGQDINVRQGKILGRESSMTHNEYQQQLLEGSKVYDFKHWVWLVICAATFLKHDSFLLLPPPGSAPPNFESNLRCVKCFNWQDSNEQKNSKLKVWSKHWKQKRQDTRSDLWWCNNTWHCCAHGDVILSFMPIFRGAYFELIQNLATLNSEKLQGFHGTPLNYCNPVQCIWRGVGIRHGGSYF